MNAEKIVCKIVEFLDGTYLFFEGYDANDLGLGEVIPYKSFITSRLDDNKRECLGYLDGLEIYKDEIWFERFKLLQIILCRRVFSA